jgi:hypothetical protein
MARIVPAVVRPLLEVLEDRTLPSATAAAPAVPDVRMTGATTHDDRTVSVSYDVAGAAGGPVTFDVYRSANFDSPAGGRLIGSATIPASATADLSAGPHADVPLALTDPAGNPVRTLTPDPALPFLVVVADPGPAASAASFQTHVLGVVVHGLEFNPRGTTPKWETQMASALRQTDGYEAALAFNWVRASHTPRPGLATRAGDQLARQVTAQADALAAGHPGDVVDVNFIGHSRGAVVVSRALQDINGTTDPALQGGYLQMTLLDPHPASDRFGHFGFFPPSRPSDAAALGTFLFQTLTHDPRVVVPPDVAAAQVFYQRTPAGQPFPTFTEDFLNLWGDAPGRLVNQTGRPIPSVNLTGVNAPGVGLVGHSEVHDWYEVNVVQTNRTFNYFG